ncbi:hypothetical protein PAECIP112173_03472 [Paenibacillus sp. JJ-100]|uniref:hypothetical protein n=1 Tax=Paenibacillus sp. JJ-100 TaxID=2974896 RepID=UPI0022FF701B|nr:hypothetical protein [Paenibacillus sp. JJ-100]CAI6082182.1 hypothetical protein PAECIP112173_03472 [Paenibacillus sp. JJ-100]
MQWLAFFSTMVIITVIIALQWPRMKHYPRKDKGAFLVLLLFGLVLSMFDLKYMNGPTTWVEAIFKPFGQFMEK